MAAQPQQPIYPNELNLALDRLFTRVTAYIDARTDGIMTQMRVDKQDSIARDEAILTQLQVDRQQSRARDEALVKRIEAVEATQQTIINTLQDMKQQISDGFAAQAERHNELMVRVERLERGNNPPSTES